MACVRKLSRLPASPITLFGPGTYQPTREKKLTALQYYLRLIDVLIPADPILRKPCMWHSDLHVENIFVNPANPTEVTSIIDWQSTEVAPLFVQVRQPYFLDHQGPQTTGLERPQLPANFAQLSTADQEQANGLFLHQSLCTLYRTFVHNHIPDAWKCFEFHETSHYDLLLLPRNLLVDGEVTYMARLVELLGSSPNVLGTQTSLQFSADAKAEIQSDVEGALRGMDIMRGIQLTLAELFPERGLVRPEQYDAAKIALNQVKQQVLDDFAQTEEERAIWQDLWPFDD